jgi:hypothetical protein
MTIAVPGSGPSQTLVLYGIVDGHSDTDFFTFAYDLDPGKWLKIPRTIVSAVQSLDTIPGGPQRVALTLRVDGNGGAGAILASIVMSLENAIQSLSRKVAPSGGEGPQFIDDACRRCLDACTLIVLSKDDPFARIVCMLNCSACP